MGIFLEDIAIPQEHRNANFIKILPCKDDIRRYMALIDKSEFSCALKHGCKTYNFHFTKHKYRIWINRNWNTDPPI